MQTPGELSITVRSYRASDRQACQRLFLEGLIGGRIAEGDAGSDIDAIDAHYMADEGSRFWVAEVPDAAGVPLVVGMVGVLTHQEGTAEIRRLRVDEQFRRRGIGTALMEQAVRFCQENNYLRIILDTYMDRDPAIKLFEKFQFRHGRTRKTEAKDLLYFYLDLYGRRVPEGE
ncbi:GNAT family N-acetyltransferase [Humisphaera borealis]|uniref:GNAT family N-acetyltransferase n=1 Tax=Humisphaera borealis TaxID=2807512 RepID=A0A7M2X0Z9_9BACT|nr:GNAT family N-acetyltransferase [Humisphaera borealis]QOV91417.1 GNAT family N-acetyltransferase [Humisphaera borealis]